MRRFDCQQELAARVLDSLSRGGWSMKKRPTREAYERPKVIRVRIVSSEMAVTGCKLRNGPTGPTLGCQRTACRELGS